VRSWAKAEEAAVAVAVDVAEAEAVAVAGLPTVFAVAPGGDNT
jgi:hypothetical protein